MTDYLSLALIVALLLLGVVWWKSGRSPFWWSAVAFLHLEATRQQALDSAAVAGRHFVESYSARYALVKADVLSIDQLP